MSDAFVLGGVRTPFGRYGGALSHVRTDDLLGQTMVWACERVGELLRHVPVEMREIGCTDAVWPIHLFALDHYLQLNVVSL